MKISRWVVAVATVAVLAAGGAVAAFAATATTIPPYDPDTNAYGTITFYDAAGAVVTSGDGTNPQSPMYAVASTNPTSPVTNPRASLSLYGPQPSVNPGLWTGVQLNVNTAYPITTAPAPINTSAFPATMETATSSTFFNASKTFTPNTGALANVFQVRIKTVQLSDYASASITIDPVTGAWAQVYPVPGTTTPPTSTTTTPPTSTTTKPPTSTTSTSHSSTTTTSGSNTKSASDTSTSGVSVLGTNASSSGKGSALPLAFTGMDASPLVASALLLMLLGAAVLIGERRLMPVGGKHLRSMRGRHRN